MLNEQLEFQSYITEPKSDIPRILPKMFTHEYSTDCTLDGLKEILTTIARGYIFSADNTTAIYSDDGFYNPTLIDEAREVLKAWTGFQTTSKSSAKVAVWLKEHMEANGWLKEYWFNNCSISSEASRNKRWEKLEKKWSESLDQYDYRANQITYNSVISEALLLGPLQNRYMILRKDNPKTATKEESDRFKYLYTVDENLGPSPQEKTRERLLKNIAAYLIMIERHPDNQKYCLLPRLQLLNWYGVDDPKVERTTWYFVQCLWNGKPIMNALSKERGWNFLKSSIDEEFLKHFDFRLITEDEIASIDQSKYWILEDTGHGEKTLFPKNN